jgi:hypothetical protein
MQMELPHGVRKEGSMQCSSMDNQAVLQKLAFACWLAVMFSSVPATAEPSSEVEESTGAAETYGIRYVERQLTMPQGMVLPKSRAIWRVWR